MISRVIVAIFCVIQWIMVKFCPQPGRFSHNNGDVEVSQMYFLNSILISKTFSSKKVWDQFICYMAEQTMKSMQYFETLKINVNAQIWTRILFFLKLEDWDEKTGKPETCQGQMTTKWYIARQNLKIVNLAKSNVRVHVIRF